MYTTNDNYDKELVVMTMIMIMIMIDSFYYASR